ncbi:helix-turn-helix transcriptional regulator [uncultured Clostridium sp.]|uniref:helix-turn-helix domain-containing protein n=1 Tax=uncultured Clostridium sp. TaxID=59620 RepID=UPI0025F9390A|nr:helix-turn-helix transcriptional regulator [uncultured Clostridium sp.]
MNERLKLIRDILNLSQNELGLKLGVTSSSISKLEKGSTKFTERMIKTICKELNVNEEWLRDGEGEVFVEPDTFSLDEYLQQQGATELEIEIIKGYFNIPPEIRGTVLEYFKNIILPTIQKK